MKKDFSRKPTTHHSAPPPSAAENNSEDDLRAEYDFSALSIHTLGPGRRTFGNAVRLDPDVAAVFHSPEAVNTALRSLIKIAKDSVPDPSPAP